MSHPQVKDLFHQRPIYKKNDGIFVVAKYVPALVDDDEGDDDDRRPRELRMRKPLLQSCRRGSCFINAIKLWGSDPQPALIAAERELIKQGNLHSTHIESGVQRPTRLMMMTDASNRVRSWDCRATSVGGCFERDVHPAFWWIL